MLSLCLSLFKSYLRSGHGCIQSCQSSGACGDFAAEGIKKGVYCFVMFFSSSLSFNPQLFPGPNNTYPEIFFFFFATKSYLQKWRKSLKTRLTSACGGFLQGNFSNWLWFFLYPLGLSEAQWFSAIVGSGDMIYGCFLKRKAFSRVKRSSAPLCLMWWVTRRETAPLGG